MSTSFLEATKLARDHYSGDPKELTMPNNDKKTCAGCPIYLDCDRAILDTHLECSARKVWRTKDKKIIELQTKLTKAEEMISTLRKAHNIIIKEITDYEESR